MKNLKSNISIAALIIILLVAVNCKRKLDGLELATFPTTAEVFIDDFSSGLGYAAYGTSKVTAFSVDKEIKYKGTASMKFEVPDNGDPNGGYVGGVFQTSMGRDLSGYNVLTFWAKASQPATLDQAGFGNDLGISKYMVSISNVAINTNWTKHYVLLPDPSVLKQERGMFFYSAAPLNGKGYTFWIDEVKFEKLGTIAYSAVGILNGRDSIINKAEIGDINSISGIYATFNLPTGIDQKVNLSGSYFTFASSSPAVATVSDLGIVKTAGKGSTVITAKVGSLVAKGSFTINSIGQPIAPAEPAPTPTIAKDKAISLYSNAYSNVKVDSWNTHWQYSTAENSTVQVKGDDIIRYRNLNFVGIEFSSQPINAGAMTHFHLDIWAPDATAGKTFKVMLVDFGADGVYGGGDDASSEISITSPTLDTQKWISVDVPLTSFTLLKSKSHLAQLVLSGDVPNVYVDNVYFYKGVLALPTSAAPAPSRSAANVISIFSDTYTNVTGTDLNPNWGQSTVVLQVPVLGNNTLQYEGLNYQGIAFGSSQDVSGMGFLHLDFWTTNSKLLNVSLISTGPVEKAYSLTVPTSGWTSVDIPLSSFSPVDLKKAIQLKFDGNGDIFIDNIYFYKVVTSGPYSLTSPIDFESTGYGASWTWNVFENSTGPALSFVANPDKSGANTSATVARFTALKAGALWAGCETQHAAMGTFKLDATNCIVKIMVYKTVKSDVGIKFAKSDGWSMGEIKVANTIVNAWQELTFDFTAQVQDGYDQIAIFPDFAARTSDNVTYFDNITFKAKDSGTATAPTTAAPTPTASQANVISVFSDAYTNVTGTDMNPGWGQSTVVSQVSVAGNNTLKYTGLNYQGIQLGSNQDVSSMGFLHLDFWSANSTLLNVYLISPGPSEKAYKLSVPTTGWTSLDIPLSSFTGVDLKNVIQFKFDGNGNIFFDNIYFYKAGGAPLTEPATAAATPTASQANVISVFSDAYTNVTGTDLNPNWGQSTVVSQVTVAGNKTLKYTGLNYQGIALGSNQDVSAMGFLHVDIWTANSTLLNVSLISPGPAEKAYKVTVPTSGWSSLNIPLSSFSGVDLKSVMQLKFDGNGTIWIDNIYFYKTVSGGAYSLSSPIDFESTGYGAIWTWNVFENSTGPALTFVANPDKTGANTSATVAKFTALTAGQQWAGCEVKHGDMGTFKLDASNCIVKIMVYKTVISDVGIKFAKADGWSMGEIKVANTVINAWQELTFNFTAQVQDGYDQIVVFPDFKARTSDNVIYFDNITFGK